MSDVRDLPRGQGLEAPTVSFSTLAKAMGPATVTELTRLLRGHKYKRSGPMRSYQRVRKQAIDHLVEGTPIDPSVDARAHEREALTALARHQPQLPIWTRAERPPPERASIDLHGVQVSMTPDVELRGFRQRGAVKFSFTKEPLMPGVGDKLAALLWYWLARVKNEPNVTTTSCLVFEPRVGATYGAGPRPDRSLTGLEGACAVIRALWPLA